MEPGSFSPFKATRQVNRATRCISPGRFTELKNLFSRNARGHLSSSSKVTNSGSPSGTAGRKTFPAFLSSSTQDAVPLGYLNLRGEKTMKNKHERAPILRFPRNPDWWDLFHSFEDFEKARPITFAIDGFLQNDATTMDLDSSDLRE